MSYESFQELKETLRQHYRRYPEMEPSDAVKLIYQQEFGGGHLIKDEDAALNRLQAEWSGLGEGEEVGATTPPLCEDIGNGICRLHLAPGRNSLRVETVNRLFVLSAAGQSGSQGRFLAQLAALDKWCKSGTAPWSGEEMSAYLAAYGEQGYPMVSHSNSFRELYRPSYRVIRQEYGRLLQLLSLIDQGLAAGKPLTLAVEGPAGSGKSTLAGQLAEIYGADVIHMDHFFLPEELKTPDRLAEAGGNIDYLRFQSEVLARLAKAESFEYGVYDCQEKRIVRQAAIAPGRLTVVEGSYSMHPRFVASYGLKVFLQVSPEICLERIFVRSGPALYRRFVEEWLPMEEIYFKEYKISEQANLILSL